MTTPNEVKKPRDWYIEARVGSENHSGDCIRWVRDYRLPNGQRGGENREAEDVLAEAFAKIATLEARLAEADKTRTDAVRMLAESGERLAEAEKDRHAKTRALMDRDERLAEVTKERDHALRQKDTILAERDKAAGGPEARLPTWDEVRAAQDGFAREMKRADAAEARALRLVRALENAAIDLAEGEWHAAKETVDAALVTAGPTPSRFATPPSSCTVRTAG